MDIHRSRFVPYPAAAINALAFSHSTDDNLSRLSKASVRLAVGRANGDIEIWNPANGHWIQEAIFHGSKGRSIEGLVWTQDHDGLDKYGKVIDPKLRLFSIGYSSTVTEWNLDSGLPKRHYIGSHSDIFCIAAQPMADPVKHKEGQTEPEERQFLVIGSADGTLSRLSTANDDLVLSKNFFTR